MRSVYDSRKTLKKDIERTSSFVELPATQWKGRTNAKYVELSATVYLDYLLYEVEDVGFS